MRVCIHIVIVVIVMHQHNIVYTSISDDLILVTSMRLYITDTLYDIFDYFPIMVE